MSLSAADAGFARAHTSLSVDRDPSVRVDGLCVGCGGERKGVLGVSKLPGSNRVALEQAVLDPFCSARCCRAWHGCALPKTSGGGWDEEPSEARVAAVNGHRVRLTGAAK